MFTPTSMTDKVALVTGAASGLGRATALRLAQAGADVALADINRQGLEETAKQVRAYAVKALVLTADLAEASNCAEVVAATVAHLGRLDALCNIAGILKFSHTPAMSTADWNLTLAVNLSAPFFLSQAAIPHLLKQDGAIVNVTSSAAFVGEAYGAAYCATKAGLTQLTKALAMEYIHQPIRINAVAPGGMITPMGQTMTLPDEADLSLIKRFTPLRGVVEVDDVADAIVYLASPAGRGYHGSCINIDRGITAG